MAELAISTMVGGAALQVLFDGIANYYKGRDRSDRRRVEERVARLRWALMELQIMLVEAKVRRARVEAEVRRARVDADLQKIVYDAEDTLDEFTTGVLQGEVRLRYRVYNFMFSSFFKRKVRNVWNSLERIARERDTVRSIAGGRGMEREGGDRSSGLPQTSSMQTEQKMFGRDEERDKVLRWLLRPADEENSNYSVLAIVGTAGVGKTKFVQHIVDDKRTKDKFPVPDWVHVGKKLDVGVAEDLINEILQRTGEAPKAAPYTSLEGIQKKLKQVVENKRFLLVLDDVWDVDQAMWSKLHAPLQYCSKGSRVLVTSQKKEIARIMCMEPPVELKGLPFDTFWPLFKKCTFGSEDFDAPPILEGIAKRLARKLGGLPLAAETLGSQLKRSKPEKWRSILESELWGVTDILPSLLVSYQNLPHHLKLCFLYCSILPRDEIFSGTTLVQLWMAQGFVLQSEEEKTLEEIGRDYLDDLVGRSFFQLLRDDTYAIHGPIHDLARHILRNQCVCADSTGSRSQRGAQDVRHLSCFFDDPFGDKLKSRRFNKLRTLLLVHYPSCSEPSRQTQTPVPPPTRLFDSWRCLRVLNLSLCLIQSLPESISNLIHLRYLNISFTSVRKLPKALTRIYNLQTLILLENPNLKQLPKDMKMLVNLRHLEADAGLVSGITAIGKLRCLQKLEGFEVGKEKGYRIAELGDMAELRELSICHLENVEDETEAKAAKVEDKRYLCRLSLEWDGDGNLSNPGRNVGVLEGLRPHSNLTHLAVGGYGGINSPTWMEDGRLQHLETLHLHKCERWEALSPTISKLLSLTSLRIEQMGGMRSMGSHGSSPVRGDGCGVVFPRLERLEILLVPVFEEWHEIEQCRCQWFPRLRVLQISGCPMLRRLPPLPLELTDLSLSGVGLNVLPGFWLPNMNGDAGGNMRSSSLDSVSISRCPNLVSLHEGLMASRRLAALRALHINGCEKLAVLPGGASADFASLESVKIEECPRLILPRGNPPPSSLRHLTITPCSAPMIDSALMGLSSMTDLRELCLLHDITKVLFNDKQFHIEACGGLTSVVLRSCLSLGSMSGISKLEISSCQRITSISGEALRGLTALRELEISGCTGLVSVGIPALAHLESLTVEDCPALMLLTSDVPSTSSTTAHVQECLHSLARLRISACPKMGSLGDDELRHMSMLKNLEITDCAELKSVSLATLTSLKELEITGCPKLFIPNHDPLRGNERTLLPLEILSVDDAKLLMGCLLLSTPTSLKHLWITDCPQVVSFATELEQALKGLISLEVLSFGNCSDLQSLPSELHTLTSLQKLDILNCPKVESLPHNGLPSSCSLNIWGCPLLEARCQAEGDPN